MKKIFVIILAALIVWAGWYFLGPLVIDQEVNEEFPEVSNSDLPEDLRDMIGVLDTLVDESMPQMIIGSSGEETENMEPVLLKSGMFADADSFHKGSGEARVYELPDGERFVRFENFEVTNGPDLRVLLAKGESPTDTASLGDYIELGKLKGNIGSQNYSIPENIDYSEFNSVVIYCKPFHVVFSTASLN